MMQSCDRSDTSRHSPNWPAGAQAEVSGIDIRPEADVVLLHAPSRFDPERSRRAIMDCSTPSYGLLSLGTFLQEQGYRVRVVNVPRLFEQGFSFTEVAHLLSSYDPIAFGISMNYLYQSRGAIELARLLKSLHPHTPIILGGTHATLFYREIAVSYEDCIDYILKGEAELSLCHLIRSLEKGQVAPRISGLVCHRDGLDNHITEVVENLDHLPPFDLEIMIPKPPRSARIAINTCRGPCPYQCVYCISRGLPEIMGRSEYAVHSPEWIVRQIRSIVSKYNKITIQDLLYLAGPQFLRSLLEALRPERLGEKLLSFSFLAPLGLLDVETLTALSQAGVDHIDLGAESGSTEILTRLRRPKATLEALYATVEGAVAAGMIPQTWWTTALPGETEESIAETKQAIRRCVELGGVPCWVTPLILLPQTELYRSAAAFGLFPRLRTFEDYSVFSELQSNPKGEHRDALTHTGVTFDLEDIIRRTRELKEFISGELRQAIMNNFARNRERITCHHPLFGLTMGELLITDRLAALSEAFY